MCIDEMVHEMVPKSSKETIMHPILANPAFAVQKVTSAAGWCLSYHNGVLLH